MSIQDLEIAMDPVFWLNQLIKFILLGLVQFTNGLLVLYKGIRVNYTRKINHFVFFFLPFFLDDMLGYERTPAVLLASIILPVLTVGMFIKPIRERISLIRTMFFSFDRPEDRPNTLLWLFTQFLVAFVVIIIVGIFFAIHKVEELIYIPIFINGIGDGLAEPIGIRFGKHPYRTYALFTKKRYNRTLEGSACVFITSIITVIAFHGSFTTPQFVAAIIAVPILMTLAEAFSPHTWDGPLLFGVAGIILVGITYFL
jgi:dolichol kinase